MTAPHHAALAGGRAMSPELLAWILAQDEPDSRAVATRDACVAAGLPAVLTAALVARAASLPVMREPTARLRQLPPVVHDVLAVEIVADCIDDERAGLLERPVVMTGAPR